MEERTLTMRYRNLMDLSGKTIIVTGACGLLGKEIVKGIIEFGGNAILLDINENQLKEFSNELNRTYNVHLSIFATDICDEDAVDSFLNTIDSYGTKIYGLVNSAYPRNKDYGAKYEDITFRSWRENIDLHLNGYFNIIHKVSKVMMRQGNGSIINMASIYGFLGPDFRIYDGTSMTMPAEYSAIKGAIINFTRYLATYLAPYDIRVNSISPGGIFNDQPKSFVEKYIQRVPLRRMASPEDIVGSVIFLLSDLSSYITGQNLIVDGGLSVW